QTSTSPILRRSIQRTMRSWARSCVPRATWRVRKAWPTRATDWWSTRAPTPTTRSTTCTCTCSAAASWAGRPASLSGAVLVAAYGQALLRVRAKLEIEAQLGHDRPHDLDVERAVALHAQRGPIGLSFDA